MSKLNIGIIVGSTREGRVSPQVAEFVKNIADQRGDANYEIVDIKDYNLDFLGLEQGEGFARWGEKIASLDGFVFISPEYNHGIVAPLKNALDLLREEWANKAAGIVSYGSSNGARAAEQLRLVLGELQVADVRVQGLFSLFEDIENFTTFKPRPYTVNNITEMLDQLIRWATALKGVREKLAAAEAKE